MKERKNSLWIKIFTLVAVVILAGGVSATVLLSADARAISAQALPEKTPEPTETPESIALAELSDTEGTAEETRLDETGISLMQFAFAEIQQMDENGEEIPEDALFPGVHDERVIDMKLRLIELGYLEGDDPTDYYGEQAAYSVQLFQRKAGLAQTGTADLDTIQLLYAENAPKNVISLGMTGTDIEEIQKRLMTLGYLKISATGYFGTDTRDAVKLFQEKNGLTADGTVGEQTREMLYDADAVKAEDAQKPTATIEPTKTAKPTATKTAKPTATKTPKPTATKTAKPTATKTAKPTATKTPKPTATKTPEKTKEPASDKNLPTPDSGKVEQFISFAETLKGKPYVWGGKGPDSFDCSGFIYYALNQSGVKSISYMTSASWARSSFPTVSKDDLQRGDILCFEGHVGIYLGNGRMLDASSDEGKIRVTSNIWSKSYWVTHWKYGKRVLY